PLLLLDSHSFPTRRSSDLQGTASLRLALPSPSACPPALPTAAVARATEPAAQGAAPGALACQPASPTKASARATPSAARETASLDRKSTRLNSSHVSISYA